MKYQITTALTKNAVATRTFIHRVSACAHALTRLYNLTSPDNSGGKTGLRHVAKSAEGTVQSRTGLEEKPKERVSMQLVPSGETFMF